MKKEGPQGQPWPVPYERPNQKWLCGRNDQVFPCALGPDGRGKCRTTAECAPILEKKSGDETGRYRCTRRAEYGGPCAEGPLPSGACSRSSPPCAPIRSLRSRRRLFSYWMMGLTIASLLLVFHGRFRYQFANPGPVSRVHAQPKGVRQTSHFERENCGACHRNAGEGLRRWVEAAASADPHPFEFSSLVRPAPLKPTRIDNACAECHRGHQFHHENMKQEQSCLQCHKEHRGDRGLLAETDRQCVSCHGNTTRLNEASTGLEHVVLRVQGDAERVINPITRFSKDHPEFASIVRKIPDPNTLRFNHQKHLSTPVLATNGKPLQCADCHQEDASGEYQQRIRFELHCQSCHSLQFDPAIPELQLPHGEVEFVKAFLGSLPQQYEDYAQRLRGITERRALRSFVDAQMKRLQEGQISGASLEDAIFLSRSRRIESTGHTASFYGCAYCHEVTGRGSSVQVTKASVPERWLTKGKFEHRQHQSVRCIDCHNAPESISTSDLLLPSVKTCASCHHSNVAPGESCTVCHTYHRWQDSRSASR